MKIMLDECLTRGPSHAIIAFLSLDEPPVHGEFLVDYFGAQGLKDADWPARLAKEGGWYVVSHDRDSSRKNKQKRMADGPPLRSVLPGYGISAVYLRGGLGHKSASEKVRAFTATWPDIRLFFKDANPGSHAIVTKQGKGYALRTDA